MNATNFFETSRDVLPASSESFWTSVFAFFLLHLADVPGRKIRGWKPCYSDNPPWFEVNPEIDFQVYGLTIYKLAVEPKSLDSMYRSLGQKLTGVSPDIVIQESPKSLLFIENKIKTGAKLNSNQLSGYPSLIEALGKEGVAAQMVVLMSYGCSNKLFKQTQDLYKEKKLEAKFGVFLWEDVFRQMTIVGSGVPGLEPQTLESYWQEGKNLCRGWDV